MGEENGVQRDLGRLEAQVEGILDAQDELRTWCERIETKVDSLVATSNQVKGGWRTLAAVGAISSAIGGSIAAYFLRLKGGG